MSIPVSKFEPIFHSRVYNYNNQKEDIKTDKKEDSLADKAEEELKLTNPEKYYELIDSIKDTLNEEKKQPGYITTLFANQMNGLIDPAFTLPVDNSPNKLTLMMD